MTTRQPITPLQRGPGTTVGSRRTAIALLLAVALTLAGTLATACGGDAGRQGITMVAVSPVQATAGESMEIAVSINRDRQPALADIVIEMTGDEDSPSLRHRDRVNGAKDISLIMPNIPGTYRMRLSGVGEYGDTFDETSSITVGEAAFLILQTDRPSYRPGSKLRMRGILVNRDLKPVRGRITFNVADAGGVSIHRETKNTGPYGMADSQLPISPEPRTGEWMVKAGSEGAEETITVLVDDYVLPRYQVTVVPERTKLASGSEARGTVNTEYNHGGPASGELSIRPHYKEKGQSNWVEGRAQQVTTRGQSDYRFPTTEDWDGEVRVVATFTENNQDQGTTEETKYTVSSKPRTLKVTPGSPTARPGLPMTFTITDPEWKEGEAPIEITVTAGYTSVHLMDQPIGKEEKVTLNRGSAVLRMNVPDDAAAVHVRARTEGTADSVAHVSTSHSKSGSYIQLERRQAGTLEPGDNVDLTVHANHKHGAVRWQAISKGKVLNSGTAVNGMITFPVLRQMSPETRVLAHTVTRNGEMVTAEATFRVTPVYPLPTSISVNPLEPMPGNESTIRVRTAGPALVSIAGADRATHVLNGSQLNMEELLEKIGTMGQTRWDRSVTEGQHQLRHTRIENPGSQQLLQAAGMLVLTNAKPETGRTLHLKYTPDQDVNDGWVQRTNALMPQTAEALHQALPSLGHGNPLTAARAWAIALAVSIAAAGTMAATRILTGYHEDVESITTKKRLQVTIVASTATAATLALLLMGFYVARIWSESASIMPASGSIAGVGTDSVQYPQEESESGSNWQAPVQPARAGEAGPAERLRSEFPETWLWELEYTSAEGNLNLQRTVPDSITTWDLRAITMSTEHGLGMAETSVPVTQPLFLKAELPPRMIRGETVPLRVTAYNHTNSPQRARVILAIPPELTASGPDEQTLELGPRGNGVAIFNLTANGLGDTQVHIEGRSELHSDAMLAAVNVRPEGVRVERNSSATVYEERPATLRMQPPTAPVDGSRMAMLQITGTPMGKPMRNPESLLRMPYGCGEQNMSVVGPNAQILLYLEDKGPGDQGYNPEARRKAIELMQRGYQRQLNYQRSDGSFSSFGDSDQEGNVALTAYVLRTFAVSKNLIHIDPQVTEDAATWLKKAIDRDGMATNRRAGGFLPEEAGSTATAAYVALALIEHGDTRAANRILDHLGTELDRDMTPSNRAIAAYALAKGRHPQAGRAAALLQEELSGAQHLRYRIALAFALLAFQETELWEEAEATAEALVQNQNTLGGYRTSHETAVSIEGLRKYERAPPPGYGATVTISDGREQYTVQLDDESRNLVQEVRLHPETDTVRVSSRGNARFIATLNVAHNEVPASRETQEPAGIQLDTSITDTGTIRVGESVAIQTRVTYHEDAPPDIGMITVEIENPTGTIPTPETLRRLTEDHSRIMRADLEEGRTIVYIDWMGPGKTITFVYHALATEAVVGKPTTAEAYAYYAPEIRGADTVEAVVTHEN